ncbi:prolyl-tRNA synthetase associated domain-containing protein [Tardiphaga sp. 709]|uniref:prolyl-tRNA synthetase associated domain-containing protein n=1 Tax=Tardiphaga sp. 709 TaxID=3076039 RepID=UPI0028EEB370|nr:prolyl-tRNA synthetase associated domain-containing protein [Tardiphaga sp. 709]WNV07605.1 prolyl-tRNA synthetase associated domain-containing protein [Tardiphaga sp. 709]
MSIERSDEILQYLKDKSIVVETFEHPPVHTVEESRALRGDIPGIHTKNLFLRDGKKRFFLFVTDEAATVHLKSLAKTIGAKGGLSFGSAEALKELLGIEPGSVSILALYNDANQAVTPVIDARLRSAERINCHPIINSRTTSLSVSALDAFLAAIGREAQFATPEEPPSAG